MINGVHLKHFQKLQLEQGTVGAVSVLYIELGGNVENRERNKVELHDSAHRRILPKSVRKALSYLLLTSSNESSEQVGQFNAYD